jgi:hypothetical protein
MCRGVTVPVTVPATFKNQPIPTNSTQNEPRAISMNYLPFQRFTEPGSRSENPRVDGSKCVDRNSGFFHSATISLRRACMSAQFIDQTGSGSEIDFRQTLG